MSTPLLNWKDIRDFGERLRVKLEGRVFVERISIPDRVGFPGGFLKNEWALRMDTPKGKLDIICCVRAQRPYVMACPVERASGPQKPAGRESTQSAFGLLLRKHLKGARFLGLETPERDRKLILRFSAGDRSGELRLTLSLIPARPGATLNLSGSEGEVTLGTSSAKSPPQSQASTRELTPKQLATLDAMESNFASIDDLRDAVLRGLEAEAEERRAAGRQQALALEIKLLEKGIRAETESLRAAESEADWMALGQQILNASDDEFRDLLRDPAGQLGLAELLTGAEASRSVLSQRCFDRYKRQKRRISESRARLDAHEARLGAIQSSGEASVDPHPAKTAAIKARASSPGWKGRTYQSPGGWTVLVGTTQAENAELTFRMARGNDLWLHVKGRPGSHVIIRVPSGKSVPLETLLYAAKLALKYNRATPGQKYEIDYTPRKYVKRIPGTGKNSSQVTYTGNKTLVVTAE